ncbi:class A beta-lactamase, partial [Pseudomonas aeruginosa]|nr:class A beta-lactamase [Pseudomonas aeruginosa]
MLARRRFLQFSAAAVASSLALPLLARAAGKATANAPTDAAITAASDFAALEKACAGRLGVTLLDTASGRRISHRQDERFPMCST